MLESYDSLYGLGKIAAALAGTYVATQAFIFLATADALSENYQFSKSQNQCYAKGLLEDTSSAICRICFYGARRAAEMNL